MLGNGATDLKFENILFESNLPNADIKIIDYGLAKKYHPDSPHMHDGVGTIYSMAPEVMQGTYTSQADVWSIGVIAYMLLSSSMPFHGTKRRHVLERILQCKYSFSYPRWEANSTVSRDFVSALIVKDPKERLNAEQALHHPWLDADFWKQHKMTGEFFMHKVNVSLNRYANYSKLKKLALMVVAHKSTTREIGSLRDAFEKFDVERSGTVTLDGFKEVVGHARHSEDEVQRIFKSIDLDGSGLIHYTEFLAATIEAHGVIVEERLAEAFDRIDVDDSGYICKEDLKEFLQHGFLGQDLTDHCVAEIIDECDFSGNGMVTYDEFLSLWDEHEEREISTSLRDDSLRILSDLNSLSFGFDSERRPSMVSSLNSIDT